MLRKGWTPTIVPNGDDQTVYLVVDDFGRNGHPLRDKAGSPSIALA
jgi:hypothetical protein